MNILLLGANGQLGRAWSELEKNEEWPTAFRLTAWNRLSADLTQPEDLIKKIKDLHTKNKIGLIVNAAAYTQVDQAETERKNCRLANSLSVALIAEFCADHSISLIHYSSDYVYSGEGSAPHTEDEPLQAKNYYGLTKSEGDVAIIESGAKYLIFRTSWLYSSTGKNFLLSMLKLGSEREQLKVVNDQIGAPTYAPDLALYSLQAFKKSLVLEIVSGSFPSGVYNLCNAGDISWFGFAQEIFKQARLLGMPLMVKKVIGIPATEYPTAAKRPSNSRLSLEKINQTLAVKTRAWQEALVDCLKVIQRNL